MALFPPSPRPCNTLAFPSLCFGPSFGMHKTGFIHIFLSMCTWPSLGRLLQLAVGQPLPHCFALCYSSRRFLPVIALPGFAFLLSVGPLGGSGGNPVGVDFWAYGKLLLFSLRCAPLGMSRMEKFVRIFALGCKNSRGLILQFPGPKNSSGIWAMARLRLTSY